MGTAAPTQAGNFQATPVPAKPEKAMSPAQARELFRSVDQILKFDSADTGLPIRHSVKRRLTTRKAVEAFLLEKMHEDKDTARVERSAIVLKKFGLLPRAFNLRPFMLSLLKEQIAGYYDPKTKTVTLLNWIDPEEQKPVLAHELTHALQDQHVDLEKWGDQSIEGTPHDLADDNRHLRRDETDTAREAALEGQAMVAYMDWSLAPMAQSLRTSPDIPVDQPDDDAKPDPDSPVLSRAPLVLKESLLFPYRDGLRFEQTLLKDHGAQAAFAAVLDRPPDSSYEVMHPHAYEAHARVPLLLLPDLHPVLDSTYAAYDLGVMGELDVQMLGQALGGAAAAADLAATWNGGVYYAAQRKDASEAEKQTTGSIGLVYLSQWTTPVAARDFARLYATGLGKKYKQLKEVSASESGAGAVSASYGDHRFLTEEGPVTVSQTGRRVFISEGYPDEIVDKLAPLMSGAVDLHQADLHQADLHQADLHQADLHQADLHQADLHQADLKEVEAAQVVPRSAGSGELTASLVRWFGAQGVMRAGLRAEEGQPAGAHRVY